MAEQSLYRRHRPRSFDDVVGQEHVVRTLRNAVERDRVHHAYLFVGSRGTGKTSLAKILARTLNCAVAEGAGSCGECDSCRAIDTGSSLDVIEMDAASNRSVDDIRELRDQVGYAAAAGRWKVYILDEAHMLTREAWNAFLKTLEEPPPNTVFVLATTEAHKVMPTIVDRCQRFDFQRPSLEQIAEVVSRVAVAEQITIGADAIGAIGRAATGSFRDALGTLDQIVAYGGNEVATEDVLTVLGVADADLIFQTTDAIHAADGRQVLAAVESLSESGRDPSQFARDLIAHLRQLLVVRTTGEIPDAFTVTAIDTDRLRAQAQALTDVALVRAIDELSAAVAAIREGDEARMTLEIALLKSAHPHLDPSRRALMQRLERLEQALAGGTSPAPANPSPSTPAAAPPQPAADTPAPPTAPAAPPTHPAAAPAPAAAEVAPSVPEPTSPADAEPVTDPGVSEPSPPQAASTNPVQAVARQAAATVEQVAAKAEDVATNAAVDLELVASMWPAVVDQVRESGAELLSTLFEAAKPLAVDPEKSTLEIGFPESSAFNKRKADTQSNRDRLADAVRTIVGERLRPIYVLVDNPTEAENGGAAAPKMNEDQILERLKQEFDAVEFEGDHPIKDGDAVVDPEEGEQDES